LLEGVRDVAAEAAQPDDAAGVATAGKGLRVS
jgi:hypothetical protein